MFQFPELTALREELSRDLATALRASAPTELHDAQARRAAESVIDGHGLTEDVATLFADRPVCTLVGFDADQIHSWVFDSERVQVAAGASETLDRLNQRVDELVHEVQGLHGKLYSAGGGGMLFADTRTDLKTLETETRRWLERKSHGLTFTVIAEPLRAVDLSAGPQPLSLPEDSVLGSFQLVGGLHNALVRTQVNMRAAKDSEVRPMPRLVKPEPGKRAERCRSCGRRPPTGGPPPDNSPEFWCAHCRNLRARERFLDAKTQPITFADLAESIPRSRQYLGYVAIDGNSMGAMLQGVGSFLELRAFSEATTAIYRAARETTLPEILAAYLEDKKETDDSVLSLLSGGDEITLVLPAAAAPAVAIEVLKKIEEGFDRATSEGGLLHDAFSGAPKLLDRLRGAGAAAGVITAHANYPVRLLRRYTNDLQKAAKRDCAAAGRRSALAWLLLTDSSPLTEGLERIDTDTDLSLDAFVRLLAEARAAKTEDLPASALHSLLAHYRQEERSLVPSLAGNSRQQVLDLLAANFFRYQLARNDKLAAWWKAVRRIDPDLTTANDERDAVARWFDGGGGRRLEQLADLLSLKPFPEETA